MDIPTHHRPVLRRRVIVLALTIIWIELLIGLSFLLHTCASAPGAASPPVGSLVGKVENPDPGGLIYSDFFYQHNAFIPNRDQTKLKPDQVITREHQTKFGYSYTSLAMLNIIVIISHIQETASQILFGVRYRYTYAVPGWETAPNQEDNPDLVRVGCLTSPVGVRVGRKYSQILAYTII